MAARGMKRGTMTPEHKVSIADGRVQARTVRDYLEFLKSHPAKRGRKRTTESVQTELKSVKAKLELGITDQVVKLKTVEAEMRLEVELCKLQKEMAERKALEEAFVAVAGNFSRRHGISKKAWLEMGVSAKILKAAGIK